MNITTGKVCLGVVATAALVVLGLKGNAQNAAQSGTAPAKAPARITQSVDESSRVVLHGNVHPLARREFDQGAVADAQPVTRGLVLLQRSADQEDALRQLLDDQQNKNSPKFHAWLTPDQFGAQFGPADADVQAVTDWLTSHGFQNLKIARGRVAIEFSGNAGQLRNAFQTEIHRYVVRQKEHFANASEPQIPVALAPVVTGIVGLNNFKPRAQFERLGTFRRNKATGEVKPLFTFSPPNSNGAFLLALGPADFATIYNATPLYTSGINGTGQSIAIVEDSNINISDYTDYRNLFGLPTTPALQVVLNGPDPGIASDEAEADLDVQVAGGVAPNAQIIMVVTEQPQSGAGGNGTDLSALYIVDNNLAPVMSESFGLCEAGLGTAGSAFENALFEQAAAQGITVAVAAGDNGSAGCDPAAAPANQDVASSGLAVSGTASTPFNVAVGGTDFNSSLPNYLSTFWNTTNAATTQESAKSYIPEITWNDSCALSGSTTGCTSTIINKDDQNLQGPGIDVAAGSGGRSSVYPKPSWQVGTGVPADSARDIPDLSLFASNGQNGSFYIICQQDANTGASSNTSSCDLNSPFNDFQGVGGTSASTPAFAAIMALVNQRLGRQGLANPTLYSMASKSGATCMSAANPPSTCVFYDIPAGAGNISVACAGGTPNCSNASSAANQFGIMVTATGGTTPAYNTTAGYDLATGLGSVNVTNLVNGWTPPSHTTTVVTLAPATTTITVDSSATFTGTVTGTGGTPTGLVVLENQSTGIAVGSATLSSGNYTLSTTLLPGGTYNVIAHYGGDGTFGAGNSGPVSVTVNKQNSQTLMEFVTAGGAITTAAQNVQYGSAYLLRVDVENNSGQLCQNVTTGAIQFTCPTGKITLSDNGGALNDFPQAQTANATNIANLNNEGFAEDQPVQLPVGNHGITASYSGDNSYNPSGSNTLSVTITKAATTAAVTATPTSVLPGGTVTLTAVVSSNSNSNVGPSGTVQFMNGSAALGTAATCAGAGSTSTAGASCKATLTTALSGYVPRSDRGAPRFVPFWLLAASWTVAVLLLFLAQHAAPLQIGLRLRWTPSRRLAYSIVGLALIGTLSEGIAGCSGLNGSSSGGGARVDKITAVYGGDANYSGSTSSSTPVSIQ